MCTYTHIYLKKRSHVHIHLRSGVQIYAHMCACMRRSRLRQIFLKVLKLGTCAQAWMRSYTDTYTHRRPYPKETYTRAHVRLLIQAYLHPHAYMQAHVHTQIPILMNTYIDIYTQLHAHTRMWTAGRGHIYSHIHTRIHMYMYLYIGTLCTHGRTRRHTHPFIQTVIGIDIFVYKDLNLSSFVSFDVDMIIHGYEHKLIPRVRYIIFSFSFVGFFCFCFFLVKCGCTRERLCTPLHTYRCTSPHACMYTDIHAYTYAHTYGLVIYICKDTYPHFLKHRYVRTHIHTGI